LKRKCEERGALLIVDEAQTGLAKLGSMWGFEHEGVVPDIFTISKHFGGGVAISATITTDEIEEKVSASGLVVGHSHSNDPMPCNAAIASIDIIMEEILVDVSQRIGAYWREHMERLARKHQLIGDIRGRGLLQGIELVKDRQTREPAYDEGRAIGRMCLDNGLILSVRRKGSVFRFVPPFTTTEAQLDEAADILDHAISQVV
jgi:2,2-dialkylglycine decarboxylase (pyruvate)